jgi:hypothetical protein
MEMSEWGNINEFNEEDLNSIKRFLDKLEKNSIDKYYRMCYNALVSSPEEILAHEGSVDIKEKGINKLISYFKDNEEYEKCADLTKLLDLLPK